MRVNPALASELSTRPLRVALCLATVATILSGHFAAKGALYSQACLGISFGSVLAMKDALKPAGDLAYPFLFLGVAAIIFAMALLVGGLLCGLAGSIYIAACKSQPPVAPRLEGFLLGGLAVSICVGLISAKALTARPDFHGDVLIPPYYGIWPVLFAVLSASYYLLFRKSRPA